MTSTYDLGKAMFGFSGAVLEWALTMKHGPNCPGDSAWLRWPLWEFTKNVRGLNCNLCGRTVGRSWLAEHISAHPAAIPRDRMNAARVMWTMHVPNGVTMDEALIDGILEQTLDMSDWQAMTRKKEVGTWFMG